MGAIDRICEFGFKYEAGTSDNKVDVYTNDDGESIIIYAQIKVRSGILRTITYENLENAFSFDVFDVWDSSSSSFNKDLRDAVRARINEIEANLLKGFEDQALLIKSSINDPGKFAANIDLLEYSFIKPYGNDDDDRYVCTALLKAFCKNFWKE